MRIGVIQASSRRDKNRLLYECTQKAAEPQGHTVVNFGAYESEAEDLSYIQVSFLISLLLESGSVDFVVTGCSSGQGMMLACNSLPGVLCGYVPTPQDAYLFGRINGGNAASFPLGLNFGWCGELNLQYSLDALFKEPFGIGYPPKDANQKQRDTAMLKKIGAAVKPPLHEVLPKLEKDFVSSCLRRDNVRSCVVKNGKNDALFEALTPYLSGGFHEK